ncbi:MAG: hypothetical protein SXU28_07745 [Pseudomonadota bacterium]|nr:hypothetical protein [Pseudomonadota bacterium]
MNIGGLLSSALNPISFAQLAMGPVGVVPFAMRTIGAQLAMNVIQNYGDRMGLPQPMIDMAQAAFAQGAGLDRLFNQNLQEAASGLGIRQFDNFLGRLTGRESAGFQNLRDTINFFADQGRMGPTQRGQLMSAAEMLQDTMQNFMRANAQRERDEDGGIGGAEGGGFLARMARALGELLDQKINRMVEVSEAIGDQGDSNTSQLGELNGELQKLNQEISIISNALNTSLKAVGESQSTLARKQ